MKRRDFVKGIGALTVTSLIGFPSFASSVKTVSFDDVFDKVGKLTPFECERIGNAVVYVPIVKTIYQLKPEYFNLIKDSIKYNFENPEHRRKTIEKWQKSGLIDDQLFRHKWITTNFDFEKDELYEQDKLYVALEIIAAQAKDITDFDNLVEMPVRFIEYKGIMVTQFYRNYNQFAVSHKTVLVTDSYKVKHDKQYPKEVIENLNKNIKK